MLDHNYAGKFTDLWALGCMIYEFLVGKTPFEAPNAQKVFENIQERIFKFPRDLDPKAVDLIDRLLAMNPFERIGYGNYDELKAHPFFEGIDF